MKKSDKTFLRMLSLFFGLMALGNIIVAFYNGNLTNLLWFCNTVLIIFAIGLYYRNLMILSSVLTSSLVIEFLWTIDVISFSLTGNLLIGIANYLNSVSLIGYIMTFYHLFLFVIPICVIFFIKKFHKLSWVFSSFHLLIVFILTKILTNSNINCVRDYCNIGIFQPLYLLKPIMAPFFIFHWIIITILVFIPTHLFLINLPVIWKSITSKLTK